MSAHDAGASTHDALVALCPQSAAWLASTREVAHVKPPELSLDAPHDVAAAQDDATRRAHGVYYTPAEVARTLVAPLDVTGGVVVDLSAGSGRLLEAALWRHPSARVVGVERHPVAALACAVAVLRARLAQGWRPGQPLEDRILCGDGLARWPGLLDEGQVSAVVLNPPYVGEKGNAARFKSWRAELGHLAPWFGPRMDLAYLFLHRALDLLAPGGQLLALTSAYWLQATGAALLRQDMTRRARIERLQVFGEDRLFEEAPGHHSLIVEARRLSGETPPPEAPTTRVRFVDSGQEVVRALGRGEAPWRVLGPPDLQAWAEAWRPQCRPLGELARDFQGFVSGADRLSPRHARRMDPAQHRAGEPIFLFRADDPIPEALRTLDGLVLRPVIRGSMITPGEVRWRAAGGERALYLDGALSPAHEALVAAHLEPYRELLEARREVRLGAMPWYRLHWPRDAAQQTGPKLVCARRDAAPRFMLDLSGAAISSDCTYLLPHEASPAPLADLVLLLLVLSSEQAHDALRVWGKRKGRLFELYAQPLRALPLPLTFGPEGLTFPDQMRERAWASELIAARDDVLEQLTTSTRAGDGALRIPTVETGGQGSGA